MDIAVGLGIAVAAQTWRAYRQRAVAGEYAAYALRGGAELLNLRLRHAETAEKALDLVDTGGFQLTWQGTAARAPKVRLEMAPARKVERARRHVCAGFELSWHRSAALVASGVLTFALAVLSGADCAQAAVGQGLAQATRTVQCPVEAPRTERLLADITEAARYRAFSRNSDAGKVGTSGDNTHTNSVLSRKDQADEHCNVECYQDVRVVFDDEDPYELEWNSVSNEAYGNPKSIAILYTNATGAAAHINTSVTYYDAGGVKHTDKVNEQIDPPDDSEKTSKYVAKVIDL